MWASALKPINLNQPNEKNFTMLLMDNGVTLSPWSKYCPKQYSKWYCYKCYRKYAPSLPELRKIILDNFSNFFEYYVMRYPHHKTHIKVSFTGSIAYKFKEHLQDIARDFNILIENIVQQPMDGLVKYHCNTMVNDIGNISWERVHLLWYGDFYLCWACEVRNDIQLWIYHHPKCVLKNRMWFHPLTNCIMSVAAVSS